MTGQQAEDYKDDLISRFWAIQACRLPPGMVFRWTSDVPDAAENPPAPRAIGRSRRPPFGRVIPRGEARILAASL